MYENIKTLKQYIEKDIANKSIDFFSELEIDKSYIVTAFKDDNNKIVLYNKMLDILLNSPEQNRLAILGNGGQGKSQFLKMLYSDLYQNNKMPIYISLQDFGLWQKENSQNDLLEYIKYLTDFEFKNLKSETAIQDCNVNNTIDKSDFYLLLDGLDEYCGNFRNLLNNELLRNKLNFNFIITSRNTCSMYLSNFNKLNIQAFNNHQILEYLQYFFNKQNVEYLYNSINNKNDLCSLAKTPLFLALLCRIYKSNPVSINNIHSKSDFIQQIFEVLCNEKLIDNTKRKSMLEELCIIAYNLKLNREVQPSNELLKLQLLIPVGNTYQFVHKLFEDYYTALFINNNKTINNFLDYQNNIYRIFSANWKQSIIFWFGLERLKNSEKLKCFKKILKFKDQTSGWYKKRAFLLCCEILGEYKNIPKDLKNKLLNKLIDITKNFYNLTDSEEIEKNRKNRDKIYLSALANVLYNTDKNCLCEILYKKLEKAWIKRDKKAPFTTYINQLADLSYNTVNFKNILFEIYQERDKQYAPDLYKKAFKCCAYNDTKIIEFFIKRIENPIKYAYQKDRGGLTFSGVIEILSDIIPNDSNYTKKLYEIYKNEALTNQYGENKYIFTSMLESFFRDKTTDEDILKEVGSTISFFDKISTNIRTYLETKDNKCLDNLVLNIENGFISPTIELEQALKIFTIEEQKVFLKNILFDNRFIKVQKSILCMIAHPKYEEANFIIELFNIAKNDTNHYLYDNLSCLAYVTGIITKTEEIISQAIQILEEHIKNHTDDFECINWLGQLALKYPQYKYSIIEFLKSVQYSGDSANMYAIFYINIDDSNKTKYKKYLMNLILDKNKKDKRNDYLLDLYRNCLNCPNNIDLVEFSIKLIKSIPLKNTLSKNFISFLNHICIVMIWNIGTFKLKLKSKTIKKIICFIGNIFVNTENAINRRYFNYRILYIDNWFIRNYITKDNQNYILTSLKKENYSPVLSYLAYEMDYIDSYKIYHPIKYNLIEFRKLVLKNIKYAFNLFIKFYTKYKDIINGLFLCLFIIFCITMFLKEQNKPLTFKNYVKTIIQKQIKNYE